MKQNRNTEPLTLKVETNEITALNGNVIYPLREISKKEISSKRINKKWFLVIKRDQKLFTANIIKKDFSVMENTNKNVHLCESCQNFYICPKVMEAEFDKSGYDSIITAYAVAKRIEKYSFITLGYETPRQFLVWKCMHYKETNERKSNTLQTKEFEFRKNDIQSLADRISHFTKSSMYDR